MRELNEMTHEEAKALKVGDKILWRTANRIVEVRGVPDVENSPHILYVLVLDEQGRSFGDRHYQFSMLP